MKKPREPHLPASLLIVALATSMGAGCASRTHLTRSHGRANQAAFAAQAANPGAGRSPHKLPGLDDREAGIIMRNYERAHTAKGVSQDEDQGMVIVTTPDKASQKPYLPPPSVPQDKR